MCTLGHYGNPGKDKAGWKLEEMIPEFTRRAVEFITDQSAAQQGREPPPNSATTILKMDLSAPVKFNQNQQCLSMDMMAKVRGRVA